jgi:endo-1,4-beta-xylanase
MKFKSFMVILGVACLAAVIVFSWGCQNSPTAPDVAENTQQPLPDRLRGYSSGSCGSYWYTNWTNGGSVNFNCNGSNGFSVSFSNANFVTGIGWSSGGDRTINFSGSCSGCSWGPGVYGWYRNPLTEYYIGKSGGSNKGSYSCNGRSYTLYVDRRYGQPSIDGTADFDQYNCSGSRSGPVDMGCHFNAWRNLGRSVGSQDYQVVMVEGWSNNSGSASVTLGGGGGGSSSTTTTTTSGGGGGGGSIPIVVRGRSTDGNGRIDVKVGGNTITTWTLGTGMANWETSTQYSGGLTVCFTNDGDNRDVQIDYVRVNGQTRQSEDQSYNTGVWQDGSCGGSNSEWLHCNGCIGYGDVSGGGGGGGGSTSTTTTTSGGGWWGGGGWWW